MKIHDKLPDVRTTIFTTMSLLANEYKAINLGQGFPDYPMNGALIELVNKAMKDGYNQYTHMNGLPLLRERIAEKIKYLYGSNINPETEITITPGATYAIYTALTTVLQPGDEVIVFEPAYDCYIPVIELNKAVAVLIPLHYPDYVIDWKLVKEKVTAKTKMIILNTPHNPTGVVLSRNDMEQLSVIVKDTNIFILSDEVYEHLIFDGKKHESILGYPELYKRSFVCFSFGKVYNCTGWKIGYCVAPTELMQPYRKIHQFNAFTCNTPVQYALAEFLEEKENYLQLGSILQQKRNLFKTLMGATKFKPLPSYGSYFQLYSYENISEETEMDFAIRLIKWYGVAAIPVSAFYKDGKENKVLRFCFSKTEDTLETAAQRLLKV